MQARWPSLSWINWPSFSLSRLRTTWLQVRPPVFVPKEAFIDLHFIASWWPFFVVIFYLLAPIPTLISRRYTDSLNTSSALKEACAFFTTCIVVSAFALPIILARAPSSDPTVGIFNTHILHNLETNFCLDRVGFMRPSIHQQHRHVSHHPWLLHCIRQRRRLRL